jgi:hypothetical protein
MDNESRQMDLRAAIVAVAGIALGALSQASLIDGSARPQSLPSAQTVTAGHPKLSYSPRDVGQACAAAQSRTQQCRTFVSRTSPVLEVADRGSGSAPN